MRKFIIVSVVVIAAGAAAYFGVLRREQPAAAAGQAQAGRGGPGPRSGGGFGGPGGGMFRPPMTVEVTTVTRGDIAASISVVGNLIGQATVDVAPKTGGRLQSVNVKLGDAVRRGQLIAKLEDNEIVQQVRQAEASHEVAQATIRQREADLNLAQTNAERSRNLYARQLLPKQTLDDSEARYTAAVAQLDLARAQMAQSAARLQELRINLTNTSVVSPVNGFVAQRNVDPGAWVSQNAPVVSVVDISSLRLVANVVEKDLPMVNAGDPARVAVDAYPGESFMGQIARVSPILDPATRTAAMEIEIPNRDNRLKPGMYAKVSLQIETRSNVLLVPKVALVDSEGARGVYQANDENRAQFKSVKVGLEDNEKAEILDGLQEGEIVVSTGAGALRRNDELLVAGAEGPRGAPGTRTPGGNSGGRRPGMGTRPGRPQDGASQAPSDQRRPRAPQSAQRPIA